MQSDLHFLRSLPLTAASLGNELGVRVLVGGNHACTDGKVIRLPAMAGVMSQDEMLGYVMHEAAHIRLTDFGVIGNGRTFSPIWGELVNALEDVRIENEFERLYEGARMILDGCREVCVARLLKNVARFEANPAGTLGLYCLCHGHVHWTGLDYVEPLYAQLAVLMDKHFGADVRKAIDDVLGDLSKTRNTRGVAAIVDRIFDLLKSNAKKEPQPQGGATKPQGSEDPSGNEGASESTSRQSPRQPLRQSPRSSRESGKGPKKSGKSEKSSKSGNATDASSESSSDASGTARSGSSEKDQSRGNACRRALCAREDEFERGFDISRTYGKELSEAGETDSGFFGPDDDLDLTDVLNRVSGKRASKRWKPLAKRTVAEEQGAEYVREALLASSGVRRALCGLVQAKSRRGTWTARQGQRVSSTSAARLAVWNTRVFEKRREVKAVDTALHVLLDLSGSMQSDLHLARQAALTLTAALMSVPHVNPALSTFNGIDYFRPIVPHGSGSFAAHAGRIGGMWAEGNTPLHEALLAAGISLSRTREEKKAILVVTDGLPSNPRATVRVARMLRASGVRIYGLSVKTNGIFPEVNGFFDVHASVGSIHDLEPALLKIGAQVAFEANCAGRA